jgi:hypothetical protein
MGKERDRSEVGGEQLGEEERTTGAEEESHRFREIQGYETQETGMINCWLCHVRDGPSYGLPYSVQRFCEELVRDWCDILTDFLSAQARFEVQKAHAKIRAAAKS